VKLLIFSDIHGDKAALEKLMAIDADYYFAAGDLANFGRGLDAMGPILQKRAERMYVLPGNHESEADIARFCGEFGFHIFTDARWRLPGTMSRGWAIRTQRLSTHRASTASRN
jgi:predicted phosphodiesterase